MSNIYPAPLSPPHCNVCSGPSKQSRHASPEQQSWAALHYATTTGNYDVVRLLLEKGDTPPSCPAPLSTNRTYTFDYILYLMVRGKPTILYCISTIYNLCRSLIFLMEENNGIVERCPCLTLAAYTYLCNCNISLLLLMTSGPLTPDLCCRRECGGRRGGG